jgi:hypothetical protein
MPRRLISFAVALATAGAILLAYLFVLTRGQWL